MIEETILDIIFNKGVSVGMLIYFIFRYEKIIGKNTDALIGLKEAVSKLCYGKRK